MPQNPTTGGYIDWSQVATPVVDAFTKQIEDARQKQLDEDKLRFRLKAEFDQWKQQAAITSGNTLALEVERWKREQADTKQKLIDEAKVKFGGAFDETLGMEAVPHLNPDGTQALDATGKPIMDYVPATETYPVEGFTTPDNKPMIAEKYVAPKGNFIIEKAPTGDYFRYVEIGFNADGVPQRTKVSRWFDVLPTQEELIARHNTAANIASMDESRKASVNARSGNKPTGELTQEQFINNAQQEVDSFNKTENKGIIAGRPPIIKNKGRQAFVDQVTSRLKKIQSMSQLTKVIAGNESKQAAYTLSMIEAVRKAANATLVANGLPIITDSELDALLQ